METLDQHHGIRKKGDRFMKSWNCCLRIFVKVSALGLAAGLLFFSVSRQSLAQDARVATPAAGYTVHVSAPHVVDGKVMGPFHHYCKVMSPEPVIACLIYDSPEPDAMLIQVEYIIAKKLTRPAVSLENWNKYWHDHQQEISTGRVQVHDLPPDKAKEVADLVATTDGIIFSFAFDGKLPTGHVTHAQSVGHKNLTAAEYANSKKTMAAVAVK
jgi:hypothetical protein